MLGDNIISKNGIREEIVNISKIPENKIDKKIKMKRTFSLGFNTE